MKKITVFTSVIIISALALSLSIFAQHLRGKNPALAGKNPTSSAKSKAGNLKAIQAGEKLAYSVSWADFVTAAKLTLETREVSDQPGYQFVANVETVGLVRALYNLRHNYLSTVDGGTMLPVRLLKQTRVTRRDGREETESEIIFDQTKHTAKVGDETITIAPQTYDLVSALYAIRQLDLKEKAVYKFAGLDDKTKFEGEVEVLNRERIETPTGSYKTVKVAIRGAEAGGKITDGYQIRAWFTDDARRIPIQITAVPPFGQVKVELKSVTENGG